MALHATWKAVVTKELRYCRERLGFIPSSETPVQWWHAASVGEIQTVSPLLNAAANSHTDPIVVTTNTTTGHAMLQQRITESNLEGSIQHRYFPIDSPGITHRFIKRCRPKHLIVMETELWPNLYCALHKRQTPVTIINARVTESTLNAVAPGQRLTSTLGPAYQAALAPVTVLARSEQDANGYRALGATPNKVEVVGNLKFIDNRPDVCVAPNDLDKLTDAYVVAASTHNPEEMELASAWMEQADTGLLVLVPRHVERGNALQQQLMDRFGKAVAPLRSQGGIADATHRLYVADTIGELHHWYVAAGAVFVGGSLIERGGHNVLEPFFHGHSVVTGPHTENFDDAVEWLASQNAVHPLSDAAAVVDKLIELRQTPSATKAIATSDTKLRYLSRLESITA